MAACNLKGRGILVTRASHQSGGLSRLIHGCQGRAVCFPALEIVASKRVERARELLRQSWDVMIFISPNAVHYALGLLPDGRMQGRLLAAVGRATAAALDDAGYGIDLLPVDRYDSEGLLMLPPLQQLTGQKVLIVRGEGGRPLLGNSLQARGAEVGYAEVYRRVRPNTDPEPLLKRWTQEIDLVVTTSNEVLHNLIDMLGEKGLPLLQRTPLLVISDRMRQEAENRGFEAILLASGADNNAIMAAISDWADHVAQGDQGNLS
ncbi:MAG: uroporphyrinogen-III synthase [Candidatus Thiodiazotropha sp. (ex Ustalcina ferruginea)]|nr:uroporphyrinogen-III synthase [Candidatus Thiodiazotropha sp. (ex Ustalcina ferruginea)]